MPTLRSARVWVGVVSYEEIATATEVKQFNRLTGDLKGTFTVGLWWSDAKGKWNAELYLAGDPLDASWETDNEDLVALLIVHLTLGAGGDGELEFVVTLEDEPVGRWTIPIVAP